MSENIYWNLFDLYATFMSLASDTPARVMNCTMFDTCATNYLTCATKLSTSVAPVLCVWDGSFKQLETIVTADIYKDIFWLCCRRTPSQMAGQRVGVFSYGSGFAATLYSLRVTQDHTPGELVIIQFVCVMWMKLKSS